MGMQETFQKTNNFYLNECLICREVCVAWRGCTDKQEPGLVMGDPGREGSALGFLLFYHP